MAASNGLSRMEIDAIYGAANRTSASPTAEVPPAVVAGLMPGIELMKHQVAAMNWMLAHEASEDGRAAGAPKNFGSGFGGEKRAKTATGYTHAANNGTSTPERSSGAVGGMLCDEPGTRPGSSAK